MFAVYIRVSTEEQEPETQKEVILDWAKKNNIEIGKIYVDISSGANPNREALSQLLQDVESRRIETLIVRDLSRIGRTRSEFFRVMNALERAGVSIISIQEGIDTRQGPVGKIVFAILSALYQAERDRAREMTMEGLRRARAQGKRLGRPRKVTKEEILELLEKEKMTKVEAARRLGISRTTLYQILSEP